MYQQIQKPPSTAETEAAMTLPIESIDQKMQTLNEVLFARHQACIGLIEPEEDHVDVFIISRCGNVWVEVPTDLFLASSWPSLLLDHLLAHQSLLRWIADVSFGSFCKSDLFLALSSRIVFPTQVASGFQYWGDSSELPLGKLGLDAPTFIITGIEHARQTDEIFSILSIRAEIPAADEFYFGPTSQPTPKTNLTNFLDEIWKSLLETLESHVSGTLGENRWGDLFNPTNPAELWLMHRALGTLRRGERLGTD
jgi:hypothetical protein